MTGTIEREQTCDEGGLTKQRLAAFAVALAGSALLGIVAGLIWAAVAPRAVLQEVATGEAIRVNAESNAYIVADVWFCGITALCGLITGILGYRFVVRRAGAMATAGLVLGAVAGTLLTFWTGDHIGLGTYNHLLATSRNGVFFHASLALGAKTALAFWPLLTSAVILMAESGARRTAVAGPASSGPASSGAVSSGAGPAGPAPVEP